MLTSGRSTRSSSTGENGIFEQAANYEARDRRRTLTGIGLLLPRRLRQERAVPASRLAAGRDGGPDPVSALMHAATMVTAGIYMVARTYPIFIQSETAMLVVAIIGSVTALMGASIALTQNDIKKVSPTPPSASSATWPSRSARARGWRRSST